MIFDTLKNAELYFGCNDAFKPAFEFINEAIKENKPAGKYEIDGDNIYAMVQEYETVENSEKFEGHRKYIDLQFIISGEEYMECTQIGECEAITEFDAEKDYALYVCNGLKMKLECKANDFAVFFPEDIHKPCVKLDASTPVKKIVVKIKA